MGWNKGHEVPGPVLSILVCLLPHGKNTLVALSLREVVATDVSRVVSVSVSLFTLLTDAG
jgi:hypothetical protein